MLADPQVNDLMVPNDGPHAGHMVVIISRHEDFGVARCNLCDAEWDWRIPTEPSLVVTNCSRCNQNILADVALFNKRARVWCEDAGDLYCLTRMRALMFQPSGR